MNYLVTGCNYFSVVEIASQLAERGHNVIAIAAPNSQEKLAPQNIKKYKINLTGKYTNHSGHRT